MVVHPVNGKLCLTLQTNHARVCREMAEAWGNDRFDGVERDRESVLRATAMHDEGWTEWEKRPRIRPDNGRPYSFLEIPQVVHTEIYTRGVQLAREADPYAALLISLHGLGLYNGRYGHLPQLPVRPTDPGAEDAVMRFFASQGLQQAELIAQVKPDLIALWTYYRWLQAWDGLSLMATMFEAEEGLVISIGPMPFRIGEMGAEPMIMRGIAPGSWRVEPWAFAEDQLELTWPVRYLPDRRYENDEAFQEAFAAAPMASQTVRFLP